MPGFDGTGPRGEGPMTGRGMGYCAIRLPKLWSTPSGAALGAIAAGAARRFLGFGRGRGYGAGRGLGLRRGR